jgi:hypothetical protein
MVGGLVLLSLEAEPRAQELIQAPTVDLKLPAPSLALVDPVESQLPQPASASPSNLSQEEATREARRVRENQIVTAILFGAAGAVIIGILDRGGRGGHPWYSLAALAGWSAGTGLIVCAIGQFNPTRHGGCSGSILGAIVGTIGILPGAAMIWRFQQSCTDSGSDPSCASVYGLFTYVGAVFAGVGYVAGTTVGANVGWSHTATKPDPTLSASASVPLLLVRF